MTRTKQASQAKGSGRPRVEGGIKVVRSVTINRSAEELFSFCRRLETLPRVMKHLESVRVVSGRTSHWEARSPAGRLIGFDVEIIHEEPNGLIAWRSLEGGDIDHAGSIRFRPAPSERGTEVAVRVEYVPPAGVLGRTLAKFFGPDPAVQIDEDLRRFKAVMETGEAPTTGGQPKGPAS